MNKVEQIKKWALDNYATSWGASVLIECYTDEQLDAEFATLEAAQEAAGFESKLEEIRREPFAIMEQEAREKREAAKARREAAKLEEIKAPEAEDDAPYFANDQERQDYYDAMFEREWMDEGCPRLW